MFIDGRRTTVALLTEGKRLVVARPSHLELSCRSGGALPTIIKPMARGWESKSVEDQIGEAEAKKEVRRKRRLTPEETEHLQRKEALMLERLRILREMERAYMRRHLVMLERGLAHIDAELAKLELENSP